MADYYPKTHPGCGGQLDIWPDRHADCRKCQGRIEPLATPDPSWNGYSVITVPVVPQGIMDVVRRFNASEQNPDQEDSSPLLDILREIDAQNEEGRERGFN